MFTVSLHLIHMSKFIQYLSFCDWLVSVRFVVAYSRISILLTLNNTPSYVCIPHFVNPFICRCIWVAFLSCGYCCHAHGCEISLQNPAFNSFEYIAGSGFASSCGSFFFFFYRFNGFNKFTPSVPICSTQYSFETPDRTSGGQQSRSDLQSLKVQVL